MPVLISLAKSDSMQTGKNYERDIAHRLVEALGHSISSIHYKPLRKAAPVLVGVALAAGACYGSSNSSTPTEPTPSCSAEYIAQLDSEAEIYNALVAGYGNNPPPTDLTGDGKRDDADIAYEAKTIKLGYKPDILSVQFTQEAIDNGFYRFVLNLDSGVEELFQSPGSWVIVRIPGGKNADLVGYLEEVLDNESVLSVAKTPYFPVCLPTAEPFRTPTP